MQKQGQITHTSGSFFVRKIFKMSDFFGNGGEIIFFVVFFKFLAIFTWHVTLDKLIFWFGFLNHPTLDVDFWWRFMMVSVKIRFDKGLSKEFLRKQRCCPSFWRNDVILRDRVWISASPINCKWKTGPETDIIILSVRSEKLRVGEIFRDWGCKERLWFRHRLQVGRTVKSFYAFER